MVNQPWLDEVRQRLARQALPPTYVQRFLEELTDHLEDLKEEKMEVDLNSRLGEPEQVADNAVAAYRRRSFLARHPVAAFLVFGVSPCVAFFEVLNVLAVLEAALRASRPGEVHEHYWIVSLIYVMSSAILAAFYGELAIRGGVSKKWTLVSGAVLGIFAALFESSEACFARSNLLYGFAVAQFAIPLAISWWFVKQKYYHGSPATAFLLVVISPLASYWTFSLLGLLVYWASGVPNLAIFPVLCLLFVLVDLIPNVLASFICCQLILRSSWDRRWTLVSCGVLGLFAMMNCSPLKWFFLSVSVSSKTCIILSQLFIPLAICWWFMWRKHDQGQLQLAA
jgi:uncharacterized membrane protein YobD (UPF0266 family)